MLSFMRGGASPKQKHVEARRFAEAEEAKERERGEAEAGTQQHIVENASASRDKATEQARQEEMKQRWDAEEAQANLNAREEAWVQQHPEEAQKWQGNALGIQLSVHPDELVSTAGYGNVPMQPQGMPWNEHVPANVFQPEVLRRRRASVDAQYGEVVRLMRQYAIQCGNEHPEETKKSQPISVHQLSAAVEKLGAYMEGCTREWVPNRRTGVFERPQILRSMGQQVDGEEDDPDNLFEAGLLSNIRGSSRKSTRRSTRASTRGSFVNAPQECDVPMLEDSDPLEDPDPQASFSVHRGLLDDGGDIYQDLMTIEEAKAKCLQLPGCKGFTFKCTDEESKVPIMCYFKSHWKLSDSMVWTSIRADWAGDLPVLEELLSIALPAYMTKTSGKPTDGAVEL